MRRLLEHTDRRNGVVQPRRDYTRQLDDVIRRYEDGVDRGEDNCRMRPEALSARREVVQGEYLEDEGDDNAQRCPIDQDFVQRRVDYADHLQDLNDVVRDCRPECAHASPIPDLVDRGLQKSLPG